MKVSIPTALRPYTRATEVRAHGDTLAAVLMDLDRSYPGIRFRMIDEQDVMRPRICFLINGEQVHALAHPLNADDGVVIVQALSGD